MPDNPLEKLTTEELKDWVSRDASSSGERWVSGWAEIRRRLERLEKCEAALKQILGLRLNPYCQVDNPADVKRAFEAGRVNSIARAALEGR